MPLPLDLIPDPAHVTIASFLTTLDFARLSESARWVMALYLPQQKAIKLDCSDVNRLGEEGRIISTLERRPGLTKVVGGHRMTFADLPLIQALAQGACPQLTDLELHFVSGKVTPDPANPEPQPQPLPQPRPIQPPNPSLSP